MVHTLEDAPLGVLTEDDGRERLLSRTKQQRGRAEALLRSLQASKSECERQLERLRRSDSFKAFTGHSALENAITSTQRMIETIDRAMASAGVPRARH